MSAVSQAPEGRALIAAAFLAGVILLIASLIFIGLYLVLPENNHFDALLWIGVLSLLFCVVSYFGQAFSQDPLMQRALAWGFLGLGFSVLFLTVGLAPNPEWSPVARLVGSIVLLVLLAVAVAGIGWRMRARSDEARREKARREWARQPTLSAFNYPAPGLPASATTENPSAPPARPPGANS